MKKINNVRMPQITSIATAIRLYYQRTELSNRDIEELFGKHSRSTINKLKDLARQQMVEKDVPSWNSRLVNTEAAYKAWGLNIDNLEMRQAKLEQYHCA